MCIRDSHTAVQESIVAFGKKKDKKIQKIKQSGRPLHINHPTKKNKEIVYYPDVHFLLKNKKIIIFEIVDSQPLDKTIADITRSILVTSATQVYFIVKTEEIKNKIVEVYDVILSKFTDDFDIDEKRLLVEASAIVITEEDIENREELQTLLDKYINI